MISRGDLISSGYLSEQKTLHAAPDGYGDKGHLWAPAVRDLIRQTGSTSVLDYGCGNGSLIRAVRQLCDGSIRFDEYDPSIRFAEYDPSIPGKDAIPSFADLVVCTDVLEHVEPEHLTAVLEHLKLLARKAIFAVIALRPSVRSLTDGRNAHLIIETADWWSNRLRQAGFHLSTGPTKPGKPASELSVVLT